MKKLNAYYEEIEIDGETYTVMMISKKTGIKAVYDVYLINENGTAVCTGGLIADQRQAKEPKVYTPEELMDLAMVDVEDYTGDIDRIEKFQEILTEHFIETDCIRAKNAEIYG